MSVGFKTKLSALVLVSVLTIQNFVYNSFWLIPDSKSYQRDFSKYAILP